MHSTGVGDAGSAVADALAAVETGLDVLAAADTARWCNRDRIRVLARLEAVARRIPGVGHTLINQLHEQRGDGTVGDTTVHELLQTALRITPSDAAARIRAAKELGPVTTVTGETVAPELPETACAQVAGMIGAEHVRVIRQFFKNLPAAVDAGTRVQAEAQLAGLAQGLRPDELRQAANRLAGYLNPDGSLTDEQDRARVRSFRLDPQGADKMSTGSFVADPELRAYLEAVFAKQAKPGVGNPDDESPVVDDEPAPDVVERDRRSVGQRQHDAIKAVCRSVLAAGHLGQHRGLPVTAVVTMTLDQVEQASGVAVTGGGSLVPMRDALRMARHAHHYLAVIDDDGRPLYLGRGKRIASPDQRIVLHANDRGCTFPGCPQPGHHCQTHHAVTDWAAGGSTDIDNLTFACDHHHALAGPGSLDWHTRKDHRTGRTHWIPPAHIDPHRQPRINHFHHPGEYFTPD